MPHKLTFWARVLNAEAFQFQCDLAVCSIATDSGELSQAGEIAQSFATAGGTRLCEEFAKFQGIADGQIEYLQTDGFLKCKMVIFVGIRKWKEDMATQVIKNLFDNDINYLRFVNIVFSNTVQDEGYQPISALDFAEPCECMCERSTTSWLHHSCHSQSWVWSTWVSRWESSWLALSQFLSLSNTTGHYSLNH